MCNRSSAVAAAAAAAAAHAAPRRRRVLELPGLADALAAGGGRLDAPLGGPLPALLAAPAAPDHIAGVGGAAGGRRLPYRDAAGEHAVTLPPGVYSLAALNARLADPDGGVPSWHDPFVFSCVAGRVRPARPAAGPPRPGPPAIAAAAVSPVRRPSDPGRIGPIWRDQI